MHALYRHSYGLIIGFYITRNGSTSAVGGALAVVMVAIVLIVVVTAVMIVTKRRKFNHQLDAAGKGTCVIDVIKPFIVTTTAMFT